MFLGWVRIYSKRNNAEKKLKGRTLWDFSTSILLQNSKKLKRAFRGEKSFFEKSRTVPKKWTLWSRPVLYDTRETFLVLFPGPTGEI